MNARLLVTAGALVPLVAGCVSSPDENGGVVPPAAGIAQPEAGAGGPATVSVSVSAAAACSALSTALAAAKTRLGCMAVSVPDCSAGAGYLAIAGSMPCDAYDQGSVNACVAAYGAFTVCTDFDTTPCVITAVPSSCHARTVTTDSGHPDAADNDGGPTVPSDASANDGTAPEVTDAGSSDAASLDAGVVDARPSDASPG